MKFLKFSIIAIILLTLVASCVQQSANGQMQITLVHDGKSEQYAALEGQTVAQVLSLAGITLGPLDRVEPDSSTVVTENLIIKVVRVTESFTVEESTLPFESQTIKNESLSTGQTILIQAGQNGVQSITYRVLTEDGIEVSRTISKTETIKESQPEILMVGMQSSFRAVEIEGIIAYISSANAWLMESNTGNRRPLVTTGDLDGRIFSLSPDRKWLLFSRDLETAKPEEINSLWVINIEDSDSIPVQLTIERTPVQNIVNYADWVPGKAQTIAYSTVEYRTAAPGWQANNDLQITKFNESGGAVEHKIVIDSNPGGIYGWWGTVYCWSPDASEISYSRADGIGLVNSKTNSLNSLIDISPYNTQSDWAWVPWVSWAADHSFFYTVLPAADSATNSQFDLKAFLFANGDLIDIKQNVGLFAYPVVSPKFEDGEYHVAFLSALIPEQSATSRYALRVMDRDGSNERKLYPDEGVQGLEAQQVLWSPSASSSMIAFIAQGNLMFVNSSTGAINQITGDSSISRIDWK